MQRDECQEGMHVRNTYNVIEWDGTKKLLFLIHANFSTQAKILWKHATHAKFFLKSSYLADSLTF